MLARKVMFLKAAHDKAIQCYRDVLKCKPNNYQALHKLIGLLRRAGQLKEVWCVWGLVAASFHNGNHTVNNAKEETKLH